MPGDDATDDPELGNLLCVRIENSEPDGEAGWDDEAVVDRGDWGRVGEE